MIDSTTCSRHYYVSYLFSIPTYDYFELDFLEDKSDGAKSWQTVKLQLNILRKLTTIS